MNAEIVNDRAKLLYHRLVAPRLRRDPSLVESARRVVQRRRSSGDRREALDDWARLLSRSTDEISLAIIGRSERARRLRLSSPFPLVKELHIADEMLRRRLWRLARKSYERSPISNAPSAR